MEPKVQHIGLGDSAAADLHIRWPNGHFQKTQGLDANRTWLIREDEPAVLITLN